MPERQRGTGSAPTWAGRGAAPGGHNPGTPRKKGRAPTPTSTLRSLAGEPDRAANASALLDELSDTIAGYMERLTKIEGAHVSQIVAEMDVNPFGFSVLARWRDLIVAHATKTYWQQVYDMAHEVRDPISALTRVIEDAADGIVQNRVGPPENVFNEAMSIAIDTGRRDFLLEAKALRDHYRTRGT